MEIKDKANMRNYEMQSVNQVLDLIDLLIAAREGVTLSQMSRSSVLSKNKIFRILSTLEQRGIVDKDRNCQYRLGITAFGTAHRILSSKSLLDHARPIMAELAATLNESVYLATVLEGVAMFQDMVDCHQPIRTESFVGRIFPMPNEALAGTFSAQLDVAGVTVYATELNAEVTTASAMLMDTNGNIAGAIVVLAPTFRMPAERIRSEISISVSASAQKLSMLLGSARASALQSPVQLNAKDYSYTQTAIVATTPENYRQSSSCYQQ